MSVDPAISIGDPTTTRIPLGDEFTTLAVIYPTDGRTRIDAQLAFTGSDTIVNRPSVVEVQAVRIKPGTPENPTMQDDRQMTFDLIKDAKTGLWFPRIRKRQNWIFGGQMRTYSDEPLRIEARHNGPVSISLSWVIKATLMRPEAAR